MTWKWLIPLFDNQEVRFLLNATSLHGSPLDTKPYVCHECLVMNIDIKHVSVNTLMMAYNVIISHKTESVNIRYLFDMNMTLPSSSPDTRLWSGYAETGAIFGQVIPMLVEASFCNKVPHTNNRVRFVCQ